MSKPSKKGAVVDAIAAKKWPTVWKLLGLDEGKCRSCGARIWWYVTAAGKKAPVSEAGLNHFADCPSAKKHRSEKK